MNFHGWTALLSTIAFTGVWMMTAPNGAASPPSGATGSTFSCQVTGVHDGDGPIYCATGEKIRLTAVAARETDGSCSPGHPCPDATAEEARAELDRLTRGQTLQCEKTGTSYSRVTAWCWRPDGTEVNCAMVRSGKAAYWEKYDTAGRLCQGN